MNSTCHPEKLAVTKASGLCAACYHKARRRNQRQVSTVVKTAKRVKVRQQRGKRTFDGRTAAEDTGLARVTALANEAEGILLAGTVNVSRAILRAVEKAADKGDARPALALLSQLPIPLADGTTRRLLQPPPKPATIAGASSESRVIIGLYVNQAGSPGATAPTVAVEAVTQSRVIEAKAATDDDGDVDADEY